MAVLSMAVFIVCVRVCVCEWERESWLYLILIVCGNDDLLAVLTCPVDKQVLVMVWGIGEYIMIVYT